jgi:hypothetical protein
MRGASLSGLPSEVLPVRGRIESRPDVLAAERQSNRRASQQPNRAHLTGGGGSPRSPRRRFAAEPDAVICLSNVFISSR